MSPVLELELLWKSLFCPGRKYWLDLLFSLSLVRNGFVS